MPTKLRSPILARSSIGTCIGWVRPKTSQWPAFTRSPNQRATGLVNHTFSAVTPIHHATAICQMPSCGIKKAAPTSPHWLNAIKAIHHAVRCVRRG